MSSSRKNRKNCHKCHDRNHCRGCACDQLRRLQVQTEVDLFLKNGTTIEDVLFIFLDRKDCCAYFFDLGEDSGEAPSTIIVDCRDIQAIRIEGRGEAC